MKRINEIFFITLVVILLSNFCLAQSKNISEWNNIKWGMSEQDIIREYGSKIKKLPQRKQYSGKYVDYIIPNYLFNRKLFNVEFQMDKNTEKLSVIFLKYEQKPEDSSLETKFYELEKALIVKYGAPYQRIENRMYKTSLSAIWEIEKTVMRLDYYWSDGTFSTSEVIFGIHYFPFEIGNGIGTGSGTGIGSGIDSGQGSGRGTGVGNDSQTPKKGSGKVNKEISESSKSLTKDITIISIPRHIYTTAAREKNITGVVRLQITFLASGKIGEIRVVSGLPEGLNEQAVEAGRNIRFEPAIKNGVPVTKSKLLEFTFNLF